MNATLFENTTRSLVTNNAGGVAYSMSDELALAQLVITGTFRNTFYSSAEKQLEEIKALLPKCSTEWIGRLAIYARTFGYMKDTPIFLTAYLTTRNRSDIFNFVFDKVVDNIGQLRNFVQIIRSGQIGRKSLGTVPKKAIERFLAKMDPNKIFYQSLGSNPTFADVLKLAHPKPATPTHAALFGYLMEKSINTDDLPQLVKDFENFKINPNSPIPQVDFRKLTALPISTEQWKEIGLKMSWNQLRQNLNTLARYGCFNDPQYVNDIEAKLRDPIQVTKNKILPFALYATLEALSSEVPTGLRNALGSCMDQAFLNAPLLDEQTLVLVDCSGSMGNPVTGYKKGNSSKLTCNAAASYFAASLLKRNPELVTVIPFDTQAYEISIDPANPIETIIQKLTRYGGGTNVACGLNWANDKYHQQNTSPWKRIIIISDNESWFEGSTLATYYQTLTSEAWKRYLKQAPDAKLICWDICPGQTVQVKDSTSVINIGGFTEIVWHLVESFFQDDIQNVWRNYINTINLN